jgi:hypothetical protein
LHHAAPAWPDYRVIRDYELLSWLDGGMITSRSTHKEPDMAINASKVVIGGLAAGVVGNIIGFLGFGVFLGPRMEAEAVAVAPALAGRGASGAAIATNVVAQFVIGLLIVWLYAAMRPRFGPGMKTAAFAALVVWLCGLLFHIDWLLVGMMSPATYLMASAIALVSTLAVAAVGGMMYSE